MTSPYRVLVALDHLELGGTQINAVQLSAAVRDHGYESLLVGPRHTLPDGPSLLDVAAEYAVRVEPYDRPSAMLPSARALGRIARAWDAGIVHAFGTSERPAYWDAGLLGRRALVRTIYEMSTDPGLHPGVPLVVGTGYLRDELADRPGGVTLVSPPVDLSRDATDLVDAGGFRRGLGLGEHDVVLVIVSRLDEEMKARGVADTVQAVGRLDDPTVRLVVVGGGNAEQRLRELGGKVNASLGRDAVLFTGPMSDPRPAYAAASIVLGMGSSAARGLAFGKPLVVLGEFGWSKVFREPDVESLFRNSFWSPRAEPDSVGLLAEQLRGLVADPAERARLELLARRFAVDRFGLESMAARLAGVYDEALRRRSARAWVRDLPLEATILGGKIRRAAANRVPGVRYSAATAPSTWRRHVPGDAP